MRNAISLFSACAVLTAGTAGTAGAAGSKARAPQQPNPGDLSAEARNVLGAPKPEAMIEAARKIPRQATAEDVARATSRLGPPLAVEYSRCKATNGECSDAPEASATSRIQAWMVEGATEDYGLFVTSCKTPAGWKAGRVRATSKPRAAGAPAKSTTLHDDIDDAFFRATCWK